MLSTRVVQKLASLTHVLTSAMFTSPSRFFFSRAARTVVQNQSLCTFLACARRSFTSTLRSARETWWRGNVSGFTLRLRYKNNMCPSESRFRYHSQCPSLVSIFWTSMVVAVGEPRLFLFAMVLISLCHRWHVPCCCHRWHSSFLCHPVMVVCARLSWGRRQWARICCCKCGGGTGLGKASASHGDGLNGPTVRRSGYHRHQYEIHARAAAFTGNRELPKTAASFVLPVPISCQEGKSYRYYMWLCMY